MKNLFYLFFILFSLGCGETKNIKAGVKKAAEKEEYGGMVAYSSTERGLDEEEDNEACQYGHVKKDFKFVGSKEDAFCVVIVTSKSCSIGGSWTGTTERVSYEDCGLWFDL